MKRVKSGELIIDSVVEIQPRWPRDGLMLRVDGGPLFELYSICKVIYDDAVELKIGRCGKIKRGDKLSLVIKTTSNGKANAVIDCLSGGAIYIDLKDGESIYGSDQTSCKNDYKLWNVWDRNNREPVNIHIKVTRL